MLEWPALLSRNKGWALRPLGSRLLFVAAHTQNNSPFAHINKGVRGNDLALLSWGLRGRRGTFVHS